MKLYRLAVSLIAISDKLIDKFADEVDIACSKLELPYSIAKHTVKKCDIQTFELKDDSDVTVILHRNEGRLLLTDKNGFYDSLIRQQFAVKRTVRLTKTATCC